jgi:integrase
MPTKSLTKTNVDLLPFSSSGVVLYYDQKLKGFGVRVSKTTKTYFAESRVNGKTRRVKIGLHGKDMTTEMGRKQAQKLLSLMNDGIDPNADKRGAKERNKITLEKVFNDYVETRKDLKPKTLYDYDRIMKLSFADWHKKAVLDISSAMVTKKHKTIGKNHGNAYANLSMRVLRAIFNFAMAQYGDLLVKNPVKILSDTRGWFRIEKRRTVIKPHELEAVFDGLDSLEERSKASKAELVRDYILLLLFTGLRRQEGAQLKWEDIDFKSKILTIKETKNREPHTLPLSDFLLNLIKHRSKNKAPDNPYVFPGNGVKIQYLIEPKKQLQKVIEVSGVHFTLHDLRRTFISIAESLDIPYYALKKLANHKMSGDVTAGYIVHDAERLRKPMQMITDKILIEAGRKEPAKVIKMRKG